MLTIFLNDISLSHKIYKTIAYTITLQFIISHQDDLVDIHDKVQTLEHNSIAIYDFTGKWLSSYFL